MDAVGQEERAGAGVIELFAVVALDCLDGDAKLGLHMSEKVSEGGIRVRQGVKEKSTNSASDHQE